MSPRLPIADSGFMVMATTVAPMAFAFFVMATRLWVSPEPEPTMKISSGSRFGVTVSPTTYASSPTCIMRMTNAFAIKPERPPPATNIFFACRMPATSFSACASSMSVRVCFSSSNISSAKPVVFMLYRYAFFDQLLDFLSFCAFVFFACDAAADDDQVRLCFDHFRQCLQFDAACNGYTGIFHDAFDGARSEERRVGNDRWSLG